jgi:DNA-binding GntR family transcriptional regulator
VLPGVRLLRAMAKPTLQEIADAAAVSRMTVSRAL